MPRNLIIIIISIMIIIIILLSVYIGFDFYPNREINILKNWLLITKMTSQAKKNVLPE